MNKTELLNRFAHEPEDRVLLARVLDQLERAQQRAIPCLTHFLSPGQRALIVPVLSACGYPRHLFCGGYEGAERTVCVFLPHWLEPKDWDASETLAALETAFPPNVSLSHRDLLGGLMGIGLTREKIGDLIVTPSRAQIVALASAAPIILSQFDQAGRCRLKPRQIPLSQLAPTPAHLRLVKDTVATMRLDAVLASGFSIPRGKAAALISGGQVSVNHRACAKPDKAVAEGDVLTCRGLGKCVLKTVGGQSRKGRIMIELERYM